MAALAFEAKAIANSFKNELGFVNSSALKAAELAGELEVIPGIGFCN